MGSNLLMLLGLPDMSEFENRDSSLCYEFYVSKAFHTPCFTKSTDTELLIIHASN